MRKTSHDGADSSSITSGKDGDPKKSSTGFNKMKKNSIKRKVQNFSHESDDGIIEPLLQTDKEKIEIANRSAKYLLNKSKTESIHEKDNKVTEGYADKCSVSTPVSSTSNMITNNVIEMPASTSYVCSSAPIHNHMNTNVFSAFEASTGSITTKNQILVEIDNSKTGRYSPSPLIFTTAKIHTDSKTKVMEPVQVTPVPILSTIEGNVVKAGVVNNPESTNSLIKTTQSIKVLSGKQETNALHTYRDKTLIPIISKPPTTTSSVDISINLLQKDLKLGPMSNNGTLPTSTKLTSVENKSLKQQTNIDVLPNINTNIPIPVKDKQPSDKPKSVTSSKNTIEKHNLQEKPKENFRLGNVDNKISLDPSLQSQDNTHKINLESLEHRKTPSIVKDSDLDINTSVTGNKKLQRQKDASNETKNDSVSKITKTDVKGLVKEVDNNVSVKAEKLSKLENKSDMVRATPITTKTSTISTPSSVHLPKAITTSSLTEVKSILSTVPVSTSKVKSITPTVNSKPTLTGTCKDLPKPQTKSFATASQSEIKGSKESSTTSSKLPSVTSSSNPKLTATSVSSKPEILSMSSSSSQSIKTNTSIKTTVTTVSTTLPSYIVSTSKTKIGSTLTSNTSAIASKTQILKPSVNVSTTSTFATPAAKPSTSTSAANGTKTAIYSKQTTSKPVTSNKDGRA